MLNDKSQSQKIKYYLIPFVMLSNNYSDGEQISDFLRLVFAGGCDYKGIT